jgi:hypothetical protein
MIRPSFGSFGEAAAYPESARVSLRVASNVGFRLMDRMRGTREETPLSVLLTEAARDEGAGRQ